MQNRLNRLPSRDAREKGFAIVLTTIALTITIPVVGLGIDASLMYGVKARITSAADAAAISSARNLSIGQTIAQQETNALSTATRFFNANFPPGAFLTNTNRTITPTVAETAFRTRTVTVDVTVTAPTLFMRYLHPSAVTVKTVGKASRRDVNVVMVVDRSGSMETNGGCPAMKAAVVAFASRFANFRDRVGMVSYATDYRTEFALQNPPGDFQNTTNGIPAKAAAMTCVGATAAGSGYWQGYEQLKNINEAGALNVILLMTDGQPTAVPFNFSAPIDAWGYNAIRWNLASPAPQKYTRSPSESFNSWSSRSPCSNKDGKSGMALVYTSGDNLGGIYNPTTGVRISGTPANNCRFNTTESNLGQDLAFLPDFDLFGTPVNSSTYKTTAKWPSGHPDAGRIVTNNRDALINAGMNQVANAAIRIRANETAAGELNTITYSIGFGDGIGEPEFDMLRRAANVSHVNNNMYDASKPEGFFVYAPTTSALNEAFVRIASEILRLAK
jgi:Flp pilus assembly protein TadG